MPICKAVSLTRRELFGIVTITSHLSQQPLLSGGAGMAQW